MKQQLQGIADAIAPLLQSVNPWERIEAARLALAVRGILVPESGRITDPKAEAASRHLREVVMGRIWRHNEIRRKINRRAYLKRQIAQLTESGGNPELLSKHKIELSELLRIRKRVPPSEMPTSTPDLTVGESAAPMAPAVDPEAIAQAVANARAYLEQYNGGNQDGR
jgi:hypothetical protein